jgi:hypothetical protein
MIDPRITSNPQKESLLDRDNHKDPLTQVLTARTSLTKDRNNFQNNKEKGKTN